MAFFTIKDYITVGVLNGITKTIWEVALDLDFNNIVNRREIVKGDMVSCHMALQKDNGDWYEEYDNLYVRVKIFSKNSESPWFMVTPDRSHFISIWINDNLVDNINNIDKKIMGIIETDKQGDIVTDFEDELYVNEDLKGFRKEKYRKDY